MDAQYVLSAIADQDLLERLKRMVDKNNKITAMLLSHIAEVDARKLYLGAACSSMYMYCVDVLSFSESAAYKRIHAARAARSYPWIFELVASGAHHLSGVAILAAHLTAENHRELLSVTSRKSKRAIEELLAARAPKPDVRPTMRKLPGPPPPTLFSGKAPVGVPVAAPKPAELKPRPPVVAPLAEDRFQVQFTASRALKDKIAIARALLRHSIPDGDLEEVFDCAVDALLEKLQRKKFAVTAKPRASQAPNAPESSTEESTRHIPAAVKRLVAERDQLQCTFVDASDRRCPEQGFLELHHEHPFAQGGAHSVKNIHLLCRAHNRYLADLDYGKDFMKRKQQQPPGPAVLANGGPHVQDTA